MIDDIFESLCIAFIATGIAYVLLNLAAIAFALVMLFVSILVAILGA